MPANRKRFSPAKFAIAAMATLATAAGSLPATTTSAHAGDHNFRPHNDHRVMRCSPRNGFCEGRHREFRRHHHREHRRHARRHHRHHDRLDSNKGAAIALGVIGTALIIGALNNQNRHHVEPVHPRRGHAYPPAPRVVTRHSATFEPWTREWYNWCDNRYRSFNPQTGTYRGYDGNDHFCVPR